MHVHFESLFEENLRFRKSQWINLFNVFMVFQTCPWSFGRDWFQDLSIFHSVKKVFGKVLILTPDEKGSKWFGTMEHDWSFRNVFRLRNSWPSLTISNNLKWTHQSPEKMNTSRHLANQSNFMMIWHGVDQTALVSLLDSYPGTNF